MRIRVLEHLAMPEPSALLERFFNRSVRVEDPLAGKHRHVGQEVPPRSNRHVDVEPVLDPGQEVVASVPRSGMDGAGALLERDVVGKDAKRVAIEERVPEADPIELLPLHPGYGISK